MPAYTTHPGLVNQCCGSKSTYPLSWTATRSAGDQTEPLYSHEASPSFRTWQARNQSVSLGYRRTPSLLQHQDPLTYRITQSITNPGIINLKVKIQKCDSKSHKPKRMRPGESETLTNDTDLWFWRRDNPRRRNHRAELKDSVVARLAPKKIPWSLSWDGKKKATSNNDEN